MQLQAQLEGYRTKPLPRQPLNELELGWGWRDIQQVWTFQLHPPAAASTTRAKKIILIHCVLHYSSQRTLQARCLDTLCKLQGSTAEAQLPKHKSTEQQFSIKGTERNHQGKFSKLQSTFRRFMERETACF